MFTGRRIETAVILLLPVLAAVRIFTDIPLLMRNLATDLCKIWGFHGGDYDDYHLLGDDTVWLL
jgi:hypothetical protein